jgi:hypothetical protein
MSVSFELLDAESGNVLDDFDTEPEALTALRSLWRGHGSEAVEELFLLRFEVDRPSLVAMGKELVALVEATDDPRERPPVAAPGVRTRA